jgi:hypothetical protein
MTIREELAIIGPLVLRLMAIIGGAAIEARKALSGLGLKGAVEPLTDAPTIAEIHALDTVYAQIHVLTIAGKQPTSVLLNKALAMGRALVHKLTIIAAGDTPETAA